MNKESIIACNSEMNPDYTINAAQYVTATVFEWQAILAGDMHKNIINSFGMLKHYSGN